MQVMDACMWFIYVLYVLYVCSLLYYLRLFAER